MENIDIESIDDETLTELLELFNGLQDELNNTEEEINNGGEENE